MLQPKKKSGKGMDKAAFCYDFWSMFFALFLLEHTIASKKNIVA